MVRHFIEQPLPSSFMISSIVGFIFSVYVVTPISLEWGFAMSLLFVVWFIASVYNFTHAPGENHLDIHGSTKYLEN